MFTGWVGGGRFEYPLCVLRGTSPYPLCLRQNPPRYVSERHETCAFLRAGLVGPLSAGLYLGAVALRGAPREIPRFRSPRQ